jgi:LCP family protein required for cell wall assembly
MMNGGDALQKRHRLRKRDIIVIAGIVLAVLVLLYLGAQWLEDQEIKPEPRGDYHLRYEDEQMTMNGVTYRQRSGLTTILFMGIDQDSEERDIGNYRNGGQADFLRLLVIDPSEKTISQIQIDRDTLTPITILGVLGNRSGTRTMQIALSHGFGDGKEQSCELTVEAVSNLLFNVPIKYYVAMNLDGISVMNDSLDGITVTLEDDFSHLDPTMTKGKTLTLVGDQAELFVRSRMSVGVGTNEARMARQQQYLTAMMDRLNEKIHADSNYVGTLFDALAPYLVTSISRSAMITEAWTARDYQRLPVKQPQGVHQVGESGYMEFLVDENSLAQIVLDTFYEKVK